MNAQIRIVGFFSNAMAWSPFGDLYPYRKVLVQFASGGKTGTAKAWVHEDDLLTIPDRSPFRGTMTETTDFFTQVGHGHAGPQLKIDSVQINPVMPSATL